MHIICFFNGTYMHELHPCLEPCGQFTGRVATQTQSASDWFSQQLLSVTATHWRQTIFVSHLSPPGHLDIVDCFCFYRASKCWCCPGVTAAAAQRLLILSVPRLIKWRWWRGENSVFHHLYIKFNEVIFIPRRSRRCPGNFSTLLIDKTSFHMISSFTQFGLPVFTKWR